MLRVVSAASGEEVHAYDKAQFDAMVADSGATVGALKRHLAVKHFERKYSRFQLRMMREGKPEELEDDEVIALPMDLQLMLMRSHRPPDAERDKRFLESCGKGLVGEVEQGLKGLQDPNVKDCIGRTGLILAALNYHLNVAFLLLEAGVERSWEEAVSDILCESLLHQACRLAGLGEIRLLLELRATLEARTALDWHSPLHQAARSSRLEVVRLLLQWRAEVDALDMNDKRPLHFAALHGREDAVRVLLASAAALEACCAYGSRPLHLAVLSGSVAVVRLLLDSAARMDAKDCDGRQPLHRAAECGHPEMVRALLKFGADKEARDEEGHRPYEVALRRGRSVVRRLREQSGGQRRC